MSTQKSIVEKLEKTELNSIVSDSIQVFSNKLNKFITVPVMNLQNDIDSHRMLVVDEDHIPEVLSRQDCSISENN